MTSNAFINYDLKTAENVEPLEQVIDELKESIRTRHIHRMQTGICSAETGFILTDLLTDLERTSDHCSNIAGCIIDTSNHNMNIHKTLRSTKSESEEFRTKFKDYEKEYMEEIPV